MKPSASLKLDDGYAAYLIAEDGGLKRCLLKTASDPLISFALANEKKFLDLIHKTDGGELARTFPSAGFYSTDGDKSWYIRDFIEGRTLAELVEQNPDRPGIARNQAVGYVMQVCELLDFLHGMNPPIIHRDVKPQNVVVDSEGVCHLIDMGISRVFDGEKGEDTVVMGTKPTMPPEQFGYQQTDQRSDIYSVGILLLYCLCGEYSLSDDSEKLLDKELLKIIKKATQFDPNARYQSVREMMNDLIAARYPKLALSAEEQPRKKPRIIRALSAAVAVLCALMICLGVPAYFYLRQEYNRARPYQFAEPLVEQAVRIALKRPEGDITYHDLEQVEDLRFFGKDIVTTFDPIHIVRSGPMLISGIYYETNLFRERGDINTLSDFENMPNLKVLHLMNQELSSLDGIGKCQQLWQLCVCDCPVTDASEVAECPEIKDLVLAHLGISDISFVSEMSNLEKINLMYSGVSDISPLAPLWLNCVRVAGCPIADLSPLNEIGTLNELEISYSPEYMKQLKGNLTNRLVVDYTDGNVTLEGCDISDNLQCLKVEGDFDGSAELYVPENMNFPTLNELELNSENNCLTVRGFGAFSSAPHLTKLAIEYTNVVDFSGLDELKALETIRCSEEQRGAIKLLYVGNQWIFE